MILRHTWASIGVPLLLIGCMVLALAEAQGGGRLLLTLFFTVASGYLAWHYTGQVWGMMASYAYVEGVPFAKVERLLIRLGLRLLLAWHVLWFLRTALANPGPVESLYLVVSAGAVLAFGLGAVGLWQMRVRTGKLPPLRVLVPWLALFAWYGALARWGLPALFLVQAFHALQYIQFPMRVELNRAARSDARGVAGRMALYMIVLLLAAGAAILVVPGPAMSVVGDLLGVGRENLIPLLVMYTINIHHYFTDGVVWKLSNPEVRRELFAHLQSPQPTPAAVPASGARRGRRRR
jgi:hypothetical protein